MAKLTIKQAYNNALDYYHKGLLAEAAEIILKILDRYPRHLDSLKLMGLIAMNSGRYDLAIPYLIKASDLSPHSHELLANLGEALRRTGNSIAAIEAFQRAIFLNPGYAAGHNNLGVALREAGRLEDALAAFRRAVALDFRNISARNNLGAALLEMGLLDEAASTLHELVAHSPGNAEALVNLGSILAKQKKYAAAITACRQAICVSPRYVMAYFGLGNALDDANCLDESIDAFQKALTLDPNMAEIHQNLASLWTKCGKLDEAILSYRRALAISPGYSEAHSNLLLSLHYSSGQEALRIFDEHKRWNQNHAARFKSLVSEVSQNRIDGHRLRVGYVSPDFRDHPVARFILPLLENHDHSRFEVYCYSDTSIDDEVTDRVKKACDHWRVIYSQNDSQVAELIRTDQIDILVDLAGHTARNRLLAFARKPAPVQVSFLGYPNTTGLDTMDYRLTDELADPAGQTECLHSEKLIRLAPSAWCYSTPDDAPEIDEVMPGKRPIMFCCFNNIAKVTNEMLGVWGEIMRAVPDSRLLLKSRGLENQSVRVRVSDCLGEHGIATQRLRLIGHKSERRDHLASYGLAHIALDTFPYHGTMTTCEALWMGVPVISLAGETHVSRVGVSLLTNIGLQDLISRTIDGYVQTAVALASNHSRLAELRKSLRQRMKESPLMDANTYTGGVETAFLQMWRGKGPHLLPDI